jgi:RNA polymerase sigma factor (sigma-70 family)
MNETCARKSGAAGLSSSSFSRTTGRHATNSISSGSTADARDLTGLISDARAGDEEAFAAIVARFQSLVHRTAQGVVRDPDDAADVVQQTWLILFRNLGTIENPDALPGWLATTARREAVQVLRRRSRNLRLDEQVLAHLPDTAEGPEAYVVRQDLQERVRLALQQLPRDRALLLLRVVAHDQPYREVADAIGRPLGSLGPLRARYLRQLLSRFEECGGTAA